MIHQLEMAMRMARHRVQACQDIPMDETPQYIHTHYYADDTHVCQRIVKIVLCLNFCYMHTKVAMCHRLIYMYM